MTQSTRTIKGISKGKRKALQLVELLKAEGIEAVTEYRFAAELVGGTGKGLRERLKDAGLHDWRFDIAITLHLIAIELDGAVFTLGRHSRGLGVISDMDKINAATINGWRVIRFTHTHHNHFDIVDMVKRIISPNVIQPTFHTDCKG